MMRALLISPMVLACAACVQPVAGSDRRESEPLQVTNGGQPFQMWEGALARKAADAQCGAGGVKVSIYDRYDRATGAWVYPEGCA